MTSIRHGWTHIIYYTSVDRNAVTPLLRFVVDLGLLYNSFLQLCSSWPDFDWQRVLHVCTPWNYECKKNVIQTCGVFFSSFCTVRHDTQTASLPVSSCSFATLRRQLQWNKIKGQWEQARWSGKQNLNIPINTKSHTAITFHAVAYM